MKTFTRTCLEDYKVTDSFSLIKDKEYTTSSENDKKGVTVFTNKGWIREVPVSIFGNEVLFTDS